MAQLSIRGITKSFGRTTALDNVSLDIASGEFVTLLGASGCGKTTLLRIIAGFTRPDAGELTLNGTSIGTLAPSKRGLGFVFQSYALFPTHTVAQNIGFSLSIRGRPRSEIAERVHELCELTRLSGMEHRYPHELSGGQQQRVALARALAPSPAILLLDEPLAALDAKIRAHLRTEIRAVADRLGITTVYVTHDQEEALSISDRIAVMDAGHILQVGTPMEVYLKPVSRFVADFIGTSNHLSGRPLSSDQVEIDGHALQARVPEAVIGLQRCTVCARPEHIGLSRAQPHSDSPRGKLAGFSFLGQSVRVTVLSTSGSELVIDMPTADWLAHGLAIDDEVAWVIRPGSAMVFAPDREEPGGNTP